MTLTFRLKIGVGGGKPDVMNLRIALLSYFGGMFLAHFSNFWGDFKGWWKFFPKNAKKMV